MKYTILCLSLAVSCALSLSARQAEGIPLSINEVMQSNITLVYDDGEFPDSWVELHNTSSQPIELNGWKIGLKESHEKAYTLETDTIVGPGEYIVIFCDKETKGGLHTDFRIDSGKGSLFLFSPDGTLCDNVTLAKMPAPEISYGRLPDDPAEMGYLVTPTPGRRNDSATSDRLMPDPEFSVEGGLFDRPVTLTVTMPADVPADAQLCVTTDGREPQSADAIFGSKFTITIDRSTPVRARIISPTCLSPLSVANNYIFHPEPTELPVLSMTVEPDYFYGEEKGIMMGEREDEDANYKNEWRRPVFIEYFAPRPDGTHMRTNALLGETRIKGHSSRHLPQKSMIIYANKRFGTKRINTEGIWVDKPHVKEVKSLEIRNSGSDWDNAHIRDVLGQFVTGKNRCDVDWQAYQPVILYVNGIYKGFIDLRERSNDDYIESEYNGLEDIDMFENWNELKAGDNVELERLREMMDYEESFSYEEADSMVDLANFLPIFATNFVGANYDSMGNNIVLWREKTKEAKWRLIMKDLDFFAGGAVDNFPDYDMIDNIRSGWNWECSNRLFPTRCLFYRFTHEEELVPAFLDNVLCAMGDYLQPDYMYETIDSLQAMVEPEYKRTMETFTGDGNWRYYKWNEETEKLKKWWDERLEFLYPYLAENYSLGKIYDLTVDRNGTETTFNGIKISRPIFNGKYYAGRPLSIKTPSKSRFEITMTFDDGHEEKETFEGESFDPEATDNLSRMHIRIAESSGIESGIQDEDSLEITAGQGCLYVTSKTPVTVSVYDLNGRKITETRINAESVTIPLPPGFYILHTDAGDSQKAVVK